MTPDQRLWHLNQFLAFSLGEGTFEQKKQPLPLPVLRFFLLHMPWPKSAPTHPNAKANGSHDFAAGRERCLALIDRLVTKPRSRFRTIDDVVVWDARRDGRDDGKGCCLCRPPSRWLRRVRQQVGECQPGQRLRGERRVGRRFPISSVLSTGPRGLESVFKAMPVAARKPIPAPVATAAHGEWNPRATRGDVACGNRGQEAADNRSHQ